MATTWSGDEITDADIAKRLQKPVGGESKSKRDTAKREGKAFEDGEKKKARARDMAACRGCRWPMCRHKKETRLEVAHISRPKGMGGDHGTVSHASQLMLLCYWHHQADAQEGHPEGSLERHNLKIEPLTDLGTSGPCVFYRERVRVGVKGLEQAWVLVARERTVGVLERRS
jgi:hypothetical protein